MYQRTTPTDRQFPFHDQAAFPLAAEGCSECGTPATGPVCVTCGQRADARPVTFYDYDDLAADGDDWGWS
jgi:hypothetical protein